jgi:hypothetical protein
VGQGSRFCFYHVPNKTKPRHKRKKSPVRRTKKQTKKQKKQEEEDEADEGDEGEEGDEVEETSSSESPVKASRNKPKAVQFDELQAIARVQDMASAIKNLTSVLSPQAPSSQPSYSPPLTGPHWPWPHASYPQVSGNPYSSPQQQLCMTPSTQQQPPTQQQFPGIPQYSSPHQQSMLSTREQFPESVDAVGNFLDSIHLARLRSKFKAEKVSGLLLKLMLGTHRDLDRVEFDKMGVSPLEVAVLETCMKEKGWL